MTQEEVYKFHRMQRETEQRRVDAHYAKREKLNEMFKSINTYPVTQHPSYEEDLTYGINNIIELMETIQGVQNA